MTTTPIANRLGLNRGWINPAASVLLLNTKDTSSLAAISSELLYLKSYLLIKEYLRFQQINLVAFDIKAVTPHVNVFYLTLYQHMLYTYKKDFHTNFNYLWFSKQVLRERYRYKSNILYKLNVVRSRVEKIIKIKKILKDHRWKVQNTLLLTSPEWQRVQLRYLRPRTRTWYRRRWELKCQSHENILKGQLKNKLKVNNKWKYYFILKDVIPKTDRRKKYKKFLYNIKKKIIKPSIKNFIKVKKYKKKLTSTINKKNLRCFKDIQRSIVKKKSKFLITKYFNSLFIKNRNKTRFFRNKIIQNTFNIKYLKTHLKIFIEIFFKNWVGVDCIIKINQVSKNIYVKKAIKGLSTANLELKRINKLDYFKRLAYVIISAHKNQNPQIIADLIAKEVELTREFKHFCHNIDLIFSAFMPGALNSYRILISGKTKANDLRRNWELIKYQNKDSIPKKQFNKRVLYALGIARNNRGVFGVKVWLYY